MAVAPLGSVTLNMSVQQANIILNALAEQPWRVVNDLILDIRGQVTRQVNQRPEGS